MHSRRVCAHAADTAMMASVLHALSRECGAAACALEMSVAKVHTGVLKVCKITTASSYCMVGKLYVKWCLLLKTKNRALVRA